MSWKDDKNLGPWPFTKQPNKWGYLNNPCWQNPARAFVKGGPDDYDLNEANEPQIWTPPDKSIIQSAGSQKIHNQCGHWHTPVPVPYVPPPPLPVGPCIDPADLNDPDLATGLIFYGGMQVNPPVDSIIPSATSPSTTDLLTQDGVLSANFKVDYPPLYYANAVEYSVPATSITKFGVSNITIMFWFFEYGAAIHAMNILACGNTGWYNFGKGFSIWVNNTFGWIYDYVWHVDTLGSGMKELHFSLAYDPDTGLALDNNSTPSWRTWHLLALTYNGAFLKVYIDGILREQLAGTGNIDYGVGDHPYQLWIGNGPGYIAQACNGLIPCIKIWNRALEQDEITLLNRPLA
jgi:hypothetical protein